MLLAKVLPEVNRCPATAGAFTSYCGVYAMVPYGSYRGVVEFFHVGPLVALSLLSDSGTFGEHQFTKSNLHNLQFAKQNPPGLLQAGERGPGRTNRQRPRPCCLFVRVVVTPAGRVPISGQPDNPGHHVNVDRTSRRTNQKCASVPQGALIKACIYHTRRRTRGQGLDISIEHLRAFCFPCGFALFGGLKSHIAGSLNFAIHCLPGCCDNNIPRLPDLRTFPLR